MANEHTKVSVRGLRDISFAEGNCRVYKSQEDYNKGIFTEYEPEPPKYLSRYHMGMPKKPKKARKNKCQN